MWQTKTMERDAMNVNVELKSDNSRIRRAEAASAKVEYLNLILRDKDGLETGRFEMEQIANWWIEKNDTPQHAS